MSGGPVVVLGDVMTDVVARITAPLAPASDTPAEIVMRQGGSAANTAAWLGGLGVAVVMVGCVGDDAPGREAARALAEVGVTTRLEVTARAATGACVVLVDASGERTMMPDAGANALLPVAALPRDLLTHGAHLHVSGYTLLRPATRDVAAAALAHAHSAGATTSVDAASAAPLAATGGAAFRELVRGADVLLATVDEGEVLCGTRDPEVIASSLLAGHREVVLKRGAEGASWHDAAGGSVHVPAAGPPGPVRDTTGAGDAFAAGWLAARRAGADPEAALASACRLAASGVTRAGARP